MSVMYHCDGHACTHFTSSLNMGDFITVTPAGNPALHFCGFGCLTTFAAAQFIPVEVSL